MRKGSIRNAVATSVSSQEVPESIDGSEMAFHGDDYICRQVAAKAGVPVRLAKGMWRLFIQEIIESLKETDCVRINDLGSLIARDHLVRHKGTKKVPYFDPRVERRVFFRAGSKLKLALNPTTRYAPLWQKTGNPRKAEADWESVTRERKEKANGRS